MDASLPGWRSSIIKLNFAATGQDHFFQIAQVLCSIFGAVEGDGDRIPDFEEISGDPSAVKKAGGVGLHGPPRHIAAVVFRIDVKINMGIDPLDLCEDTCEGHGVASIKLGCNRVMRQDGNRCQ